MSKRQSMDRLGFHRRGHAAVMTIVMGIPLLGAAALAIDMGMLYSARTDAQAAADAAALAGAWALQDEDRLKGEADSSDEIEAARDAAIAAAAKNKVLTVSPEVDRNDANSPDGDLVVGYLSDPSDPNENLSLDDPNSFNTVQVLIRRDAVRNGAVTLFFARVLGFESSNVAATASATFKDGVTGFRVTETTGNSSLMPFALKLTAWEDLLDGTLSHGDGYLYDPELDIVIPGADGINELNLYPGGGTSQLPPGNFGTIDIGNPDNDTAALSKQITDGVSAEDLEWHGGELSLGPDGTLELTGETGLSAGIKDDLESIVGQPRTIALFESVSGPGNNSVFKIVGFAGVRIMAVKLTGAMDKKYLMIQPAFVTDDSAITGVGEGPSYFVYQPVLLSR